MATETFPSGGNFVSRIVVITSFEKVVLLIAISVWLKELSLF